MAVTWMKTGAASAQMAAQEQVAQQQQAESRGRTWRFSIKEGEDAKITFVDGELSPDGLLLPPRYYEHHIQIGGKWGNFFVCPEKTQPEMGYKCPLCEAGDRAALVALFTVIDHRTYQAKNGKEYTNQRRLLVAKTITMEVLTKIAAKRGGLAGCTFDVSRTGENSAAVGSMFDFSEKNDVEFLRQQFTMEVEDPKTKQKTVQTYFVPVDYEQEIVFHTPEEMLKMGLGKSQFAGVVGGVSPSGQKPAGSNYSKQL
jgi:hypothetical protein